MSSAPAPRHRYTFEEYLELEEVARVRHEFFDGEIYAMAGGTPEHAAMAATITATLSEQLKGTPCIVEVLSASTAEYDRGEKLQHYQRIASLEAIVLVDHAGERVDVWLRSERVWTSSFAGRGERVRLEAVHCELSVDDVLAAAHDA